MMAEVDKDKSGGIDFNEFLYMMTEKIGERDTKEELMKAFRIIDHDKNVNNFYFLGLFFYLFNFTFARNLRL
jgi:calcium-binding protein CML